MPKLTKTLKYCYSKKFSCYTSVYTYETSDDQTGSGLVPTTITQHVNQLVQEIKDEFNEEDNVRLTISTDGLEDSIRIPYYQVGKLDSDKIEDVVSMVMQSSKHLPLGKWNITIHSVDKGSIQNAKDNNDNSYYQFSGAAKRRLLSEPIYDWLIATDSDGKRNRNVFETSGNDNLCLVKVSSNLFSCLNFHLHFAHKNSLTLSTGN